MTFPMEKFFLKTYRVPAALAAAPVAGTTHSKQRGGDSTQVTAEGRVNLNASG